MSGLTQCAACGYITDANDASCVRCGRVFDEPAPEQQTAAVDDSAWGSPASESAGSYTTYAPVRRRANPVLVIGSILVALTAACLIAFYFVFVKPEIEQQSHKEDLKALLKQQPDFVADCEGEEGDFTYTGRMARKGKRFLFMIDFPRAILLDDPSRTGKTPISALIEPGANVEIIVPELQSCIEVPRGTKNMPKSDPIQDILQFVDDKKYDVTDFGRSTLGTYQTRMFRISTPDGSRRDAYVELAPELQNLIVGLDFNDDWTSYEGALKYKLSNVKLEVDEDLFRVPTTYTKLARSPCSGAWASCSLRVALPRRARCLRRWALQTQIRLRSFTE